jgi:hypothetical protein
MGSITSIRVTGPAQVAATMEPPMRYNRGYWKLIRNPFSLRR